jgi:hypothetical protein
MSNVYHELIRLLPTTDTIVGRILSIDTVNNTAVLISMGGAGSFTANIGKGSTYAVSNWVLVRDNVIVSTIPTPEGVSEGVATDISIF